MTGAKLKSVVRAAVGCFCLAALACVLSPARGAAQSSEWVGAEHGAVRLIGATRAVGDGETVNLGLRFELRDGWKIYWRSPGDAGFPPSIDWTGSSNLADARLSWPIPVRFSILGLETIGYKHEVVLPIAARLARPGEALDLRAAVDYLACSDICVPYTANLTLTVPAGPAEPGEFAPLISRFENRVPGKSGTLGLAIDGVTAAGGDTGATLRLTATSAMPFTQPDAFIEGPVELVFGPPQVDLINGGRTAILDIAVFGAEDLDRPLAGLDLAVTLVDGDRAVERTLAVENVASPASGAEGPAAETASLFVMLALGFLGGLILNLMPCVLPVLSIKLLGAVGHGGGDPRRVRLSFIASALGIVFSFMVLAATLAAMKTFGAPVSWGLQFQQPWFLTAMVLVMTLFAFNLWGLFEIRLPDAIADAGVRAGHVHGLGGHFLMGALATLLATPCSAPFLGTAIGFALARGTGEIFAIFAALGAGLAAPYLAVAAVPRLATALPRPGPWMIWLRRVMGVALAATGLWLLSVLAAEAGVAGALTIGALAVAAAVAVSVAARSGHRLAKGGRWLAAGLAVTALAIPMPAADHRPETLDGAWIPFDEAAIPGLVGDGRVVFVNITADWCITCKVNDAMVLSTREVGEKLGSDNVVAMRGDWTRPDEGITRYLAGFGRYGIPFDAVYGPGLPDGEALPELLTTDMVLGAIDRAATAPR
jgi:suppressor for copper-sensitivity B